MSEQSLMKVPDWIDVTDTTGKDSFEVEDLILPRILIAQKLSPQVDSDSESYIDGLKLGNIFNSVTGKIFRVKKKLDGQVKYLNKLNFIVIRAMKPRYAIFDKDGKQLVYDVGPKDKRAQWGPGNKKPIAQKTFDYLIYVLQTKELAILTMKVTNVNTARKLNTSLTAAKGPIYSTYYDLTVEKKVNGNRNWYVWIVNARGYIPKDTFAICTELYNQMSGMDRIKTDADDSQDDDDDDSNNNAPDQDDVMDTTAEDVTDDDTDSNTDVRDDGEREPGFEESLESEVEADLTEDDIPF